MLTKTSVALQSMVPTHKFSSKGALVRGARVHHVTLLAPLLIFLVIGPPILSNSLIHVSVMLDSREAARLPEFALSLMSFLSRWALLGLLIGAAVVLPWIAGGAAGRYADFLDPQTRYRQPFSAHAGRSYGRIVAIVLGFGAIFIAGSIAESFLLSSANSPSLPVTYLKGLSISMVRTVLATWMWLSIAVVALDDRGAIGAIRRAANFVRSRPKAFAILIVVLTLGHAVSHAIVQIQEAMRIADAPIAYVLVNIAHGGWSAYLMALTLAWAVAFLHEWRRVETVTLHGLT